MNGEVLLNQFQELAERLDITIVQGKGDFVGGGCTVNSKRFIVLNKVRPLEQRLRILAQEFANLDLEGCMSSRPSGPISKSNNYCPGTLKRCKTLDFTLANWLQLSSFSPYLFPPYPPLIVGIIKEKLLGWTNERVSN